MAEARDKLLKLTECSICFKEFTDPRMLPCIHTFCLGCLKQLNAGGMYTPPTYLSCPLCDSNSDIPAEGLDGLKKNFFIENLIEITKNVQLNNMSAIACDICKVLYEGNKKTKNAAMRCLECKDNFCHMCAKAHTLHKSSKNHPIVQIGSETEEDIRRMFPTRNCTVHNQKPLEYYCPECKKIVCVSCVVETHVSHGCKDVSTVEEEFRQVIEGNALKMSAYAVETLSKKTSVEERKKNMLLKLQEVENNIQARYLELKKLIDIQIKHLMRDLSGIKNRQIGDFENEIEDINRNHTILKQFEAYCTELRSKGSASDICSCVDELIARTNELEEDHEAFIGRPYYTTTVSFKATDLGELAHVWSSNIVGRIEENPMKVENCVLIAGLYDGQNLTKDVAYISLHYPQEVDALQQIPTTMQNGAAAAVYRNVMYVTGIGDKYEEIWTYNLDSDWMKCASLVQGRSRHSSAFLDEVLYICGGYVESDRSVLDSIEAYNASSNISTSVGKLVHSVNSSGNCVPFKSSLYIFGGTDKSNNALNQVQVYDTKRNICTLLSRPMPRGYSLMQAAVWDTSVVLLGCYACFIFNFKTETWQERNHFKTDVVHFGLVFENGRIFVIGGGTSARNETGTLTWTCRDDVRYVSLKNIIDDKPIEWKSYAKLEKPVLVQTY